ncbi:GTPase HflX [bacterium]|nr:GTPase HflX [bacterium]
MKEVFGNIIGIKPSQIKRLENIYRRKIDLSLIVPLDLASSLLEISNEIGRQVGILVSRAGYVDYVAVGDFHKIVLPDFGRLRVGSGRFRGLRFIHTHLNREPLSRDDLVDLVILRLDLVASISLDFYRQEPLISIGYLLPQNSEEKFWKIVEPQSISKLNLNFIEFIEALEEEFTAKSLISRKIKSSQERAVLVHVSDDFDRLEAEEALNELKELVWTAGVEAVDTALQFRKKLDPKYLLGKGKLEDLVIKSVQSEADIIIFNQDLTPTQARIISEMTDLKVLDRTQLILDIFAQRAQSSDGKMQVELAQLKYRLPRLTRLDNGLSRLTGGIGGRGPGETKLEISRRRVREQISHLETKLKNSTLSRRERRKKRKDNKIPIVAIIGYTNAGKSTLLNGLTLSHEYTDDKLFATLDPHARLLCFRGEMSQDDHKIWNLEKIILVDTVGFIRHLPKDLLAAFRATLEELEDADFFLHLVDGSFFKYSKHIEIVEEVLVDLGLANIPQLLVMNKIDKITQKEKEKFIRQYNGLAISALKGDGLEELKMELAKRLWSITSLLGKK